MKILFLYYAASGLLVMSMGCASGRPADFLLPENRITYEQGELLLEEGERQIAEGDRTVQEGRDLKKRADQLIRDGREIRRAGEATASRGRDALRAARMLEESEKLRREGQELRDGAFHD